MVLRGRVRGWKLRSGIGPNSALRANAAWVAAILRLYFRCSISIGRWPHSKATPNAVNKLDGEGDYAGIVSQRHVDLRSESQGNSRREESRTVMSSICEPASSTSLNF